MISPSVQRQAYERIARGQGNRAGKGAPLRDAFFITSRDGDTLHPLASLMNSRSGSGGGRGGRTRVLLYLSLLWVAGGSDHSTRRPARFWAELLGLRDPSGAGGRAVRSSWQELEHRRFITVTPAATSGDSPTIRPLKEDGSGDPYEIPRGLDGDTYRRIPDIAWRRLFSSEDLSGPGLAMYLVALRAHGQARNQPLVFPRGHFKSEYGLGESTRKSGLRNLVSLSILEEQGLSVETGQGSDRKRGRVRYDLLSAYDSTPKMVWQEP